MLPLDWDIFELVVSHLPSFCDVDYFISLYWYIVSDMLNFKVVSEYLLHWNSLLLLNIVDVLLFVRNHLDSALGGRRIRSVDVDPLAPCPADVAP